MIPICASMSGCCGGGFVVMVLMDLMVMFFGFSWCLRVRDLVSPQKTLEKPPKKI